VTADTSCVFQIALETDETRENEYD